MEAVRGKRWFVTQREPSRAVRKRSVIRGAGVPWFRAAGYKDAEVATLKTAAYRIRAREHIRQVRLFRRRARHIQIVSFSLCRDWH
jgi:hypothetical protein